MFLNARTGTIISTVPNVPADELWFNPGDELVYAANNTTNVLKVVDPERRALIQSVPDVGGRKQAAFAENNHVFTPVRTTKAFVTQPSSDNTECSVFGFQGTGCVAVFTHAEAESKQTGISFLTWVIGARKTLDAAISRAKFSFQYDYAARRN